MDDSAQTVTSVPLPAEDVTEKPVQAGPPHRHAPPTRVVTKGWFTLKETTADVGELARKAVLANSGDAPGRTATAAVREVWAKGRQNRVLSSPILNPAAQAAKFDA